MFHLTVSEQIHIAHITRQISEKVKEYQTDEHITNGELGQRIAVSELEIDTILDETALYRTLELLAKSAKFVGFELDVKLRPSGFLYVRP